MNLLDAKLYDPSTAETKACNSNIAMTALDTTNLRLTVTVPAHGMLRVYMSCAYQTANANDGTPMLGVLENTTVRGRILPSKNGLGAGSSAGFTSQLVADFVITGLTPGSITLDAAYAVEATSGASPQGIKIGGPNNTTGTDAWGGFVFAIYDPRPLKLAQDGGVNVTQFGGTNGTFAAGRPEVNTTHAAGTAWGSGAITAASIADGAIDRATFAADTGLQPARSNTAQAGAAGTVTLDASASSTTDFYKGMWVYLTGGTGVGQARLITAYNGTTKVATVVPNWATNPDNTSTFAVVANAGGDVQAFGGTAGTFASGRPEVNTTHAAGTAWNSGGITKNTFSNDSGLTPINTGQTQMGSTASTVLLDTGASSTNDYYKGAYIYLVNGTGAGQARLITAYDGSNKSATITPDWVTTPFTTDYVVCPFAGVNVVQISDDTTAANNLEAACDGTGYNLGGGSIVAASVTTSLPSNIKKNQALSSFVFLMTDSTTHLPATGKTVTVTRSIDGAAFAAGTLSAVTEISDGLYKVDFAAADLNGNVVMLKATATGCDTRLERIVTQP